MLHKQKIHLTVNFNTRIRNRVFGTVISLQTRNRLVISLPLGARHFILPQGLSGTRSPVEKRLGCEAEHWPSSRPEVKNKWSLSSIPHVVTAWIGKNFNLKNCSLKLQWMTIWVLSSSMNEYKNCSIAWRSAAFPESTCKRACKCPAGNKIHICLSLFRRRRCSLCRSKYNRYGYLNVGKYSYSLPF